MSYTLPELLNDINLSKKNLLRISDDNGYYPLYVILRCMNGLDTILLVNELNIRRNVISVHAHDFLIACVPKKKRYNKWLKKEANSDIDLIMKYYNFSRIKAMSALNILSKEQLTEIKIALNHDDCITRKED